MTIEDMSSYLVIGIKQHIYLKLLRSYLRLGIHNTLDVRSSMWMAMIVT